jgi:hypothetical protein
MNRSGVLTTLLLLFLLSCKREDVLSEKKGKVTLSFQHKVGNQNFAFNIPYLRSNGEDFTVSRLKYYIANISLIDSAGNSHSFPSDYHLVDQSKPSSLNIALLTDETKYKAIQFLIGVDSTRNVSGAQTGDLDPTLDMFWTWNTGYIMAKLEGTSSLSNLPNGRIEYHIGGFKGPESVLRTITLPFSQTVPVTADKTLTIQVSADLLRWFNGSVDLSISLYPTCTSPGLLASRYADNYAGMFTLTSLQSQ